MNTIRPLNCPSPNRSLPAPPPLSASAAHSEKITSPRMTDLLSRAQVPKPQHTNFFSPLAPPSPPKTNFTHELQQGAESLVEQIDTVVQNIEASGKFSPDRMMTEFLKLNLLDPNNSIETHNELSEAMSCLRQKAIDDSLAASERAQELQQKAEEYVGLTSVIQSITCALSVLTGVCASFHAFLTVAFQAGSASAQAVFAGATSTAMAAQSTKAAIDQGAKAGQASMNDACSKSALSAQALRASADHAQSSLENEQAIIESLVESRSQITESVLKMIQDRGAVSRKLNANWAA